MTEQDFCNEKLYLTTMHFARELLLSGIISEPDYKQFDTKMLAKYCPKSGDLLSGKPLIEARIRALMETQRGMDRGLRRGSWRETGQQ